MVGRLIAENMRTVLAVLVAAFVGFSGSQVVAAPIDGTIQMGGDWQPLSGGSSSGIVGADEIDFIGDDALVTAVSGDFAPPPAGNIVVGDTATMTDFVFSPFSPVTPLWSLKGFTFDLNSISVNNQTSTDLNIVGSGVIKKTGFTDTPFDFSFSGDTVQGAVFSFSTTNTPVPVPATIGLLGIGLIGLGALARRRKVAA